MTGQKLLVANRGEIAIRIFRSAADLGMASIAIYPADDSASLHVEKADTAIALPGRGVAAYLEMTILFDRAYPLILHIARNDARKHPAQVRG